MNFYRKLIIFFKLMLVNTCIFAAEPYPTNVKLFVVSKLNLADIKKFEQLDINVELFDASLLKRIESALSANLSMNLNIAKSQVRKRVNSNFESLQTAFGTATKVRNLIDEFEIKQFPAAVVNNETVIYGTVDPYKILKQWLALQ